MTTSPKTIDTPTWVTAPPETASTTTAPQPAKTRMKVPMNSETYRCIGSGRAAGRGGAVQARGLDRDQLTERLRVRLDHEELPLVAVGVGRPDLVLEGVATGRAHLLVGSQARLGQAL